MIHFYYLINAMNTEKQKKEKYACNDKYPHFLLTQPYNIKYFCIPMSFTFDMSPMNDW